MAALSALLQRPVNSITPPAAGCGPLRYSRVRAQRVRTRTCTQTRSSPVTSSYTPGKNVWWQSKMRYTSPTDTQGAACPTVSETNLHKVHYVSCKSQGSPHLVSRYPEHVPKMCTLNTRLCHLAGFWCHFSLCIHIHALSYLLTGAQPSLVHGNSCGFVSVCVILHNKITVCTCNHYWHVWKLCAREN